MAKMGRAHFQLIADTLKEAGNRHNASNLERRYYAEAFAARLAATNPQFKRDRFIAACLEQ